MKLCRPVEDVTCVQGGGSFIDYGWADATVDGILTKPEIDMGAPWRPHLVDDMVSTIEQHAAVGKKSRCLREWISLKMWQRTI
eukprot:10781685-Lingulodinium_polyedra.AAC.1